MVVLHRKGSVKRLDKQQLLSEKQTKEEGGVAVAVADLEDVVAEEEDFLVAVVAEEEEEVLISMAVGMVNDEHVYLNFTTLLVIVTHNLAVINT